MRRLLCVLALCPLIPAVLPAQTWEVGGAAGYGLYRDLNAKSPAASGRTGFATGFAFGGVLGDNMSEHIGGEIRYTYRADDLRISSGSTEATREAESHALHYDVLIHATRRAAAIRPFVALGAGVKFFRATGPQTFAEPFPTLVLFAHQSQAKPLASVGGGVKFSTSRRTLVRIDFRDYATPRPDRLLVPAPGATISGWMHDFVFLAGISGVF